MDDRHQCTVAAIAGSMAGALWIAVAGGPTQYLGFLLIAAGFATCRGT